MVKKRNNDQGINRVTEFKTEFENLLRKYKIIPDPIIGFDMIAFMSNFSERQISRIAKEDKDFPTVYELSYHNKGCRLSEVEQWIENHKKTIPMTDALQPLQVLQ